MKQPTIFDYISKSLKEVKDYQVIPLQKTRNIIEQKDNLTKTYIQKNLSQVIKDQEDFHYIKELLGKSWFKQENGFGFTDQENIMVFSTIQDFNNKFFNLYKLNDFEPLKGVKLQSQDLKEDRNLYLTLNGMEYNSYYLFKASQILGENFRAYQHQKLKLLFLRNSIYAALICPKF